ncbi:hypothetical protein UFOVP543_18 [uncultured Caudovirales phage]|uniref:Uncharacterized protein n=1 Tax=uncultured Caudovirales phage TaxID=2100421 RepID=A0A6J5N160_9CAUD|nr:hypothetical protein UFOVP543_18 [uncultured Caudovirales phage]CAB4163741.1 hypothetical protein UFOVP804_46 [uncultured Caudovirales phage]
MIPEYVRSKKTSELRQMVGEIQEAMALQKSTIDSIYEELLERYSAKFTAELAESGKQDGEMTREIDGHRLTFAVKAKVKWDSSKLQEVASSLDPNIVYKVFKIDFSVPERTFKALTDDKLIQAISTARTVEYAAPKIVFA